MGFDRERERIRQAIKAARLRNDMTQEQVAEELGITLSAYNKLERGETELKMAVALGLSRLFGISLYELIGENEEGAENAHHLAERPSEYRRGGSASPSQVVIVLNTFEKRSPRAEEFMRKLVRVIREFDLQDFADFTEDDDEGASAPENSPNEE